MKYEGGLKQVSIHNIGNFNFEDYPDEIEEQRVQNFIKFHVSAIDGVDLHKSLASMFRNLLMKPTQARKRSSLTMILGKFMNIW